MKPKVVSLCESNYRQAAATLRVIADKIDRGDFGTVNVVAIVIDADEMNVHGCGPHAELPNIHFALQKGANFLAMPVMMKE